ncbi:MAG: hypothetical protein MUF31_11495 [Akkermansiaceae bacterium]|jgi:hypothetical protein|nr:hypothetical protein [Akkermansiaceae bacterium]
MNTNPELEKHLRRVRIETTPPEVALPENFISRVLTTKNDQKATEHAFTSTAAVATLLAVVYLGVIGIRHRSATQETPACAGWLEMEQQQTRLWE